jgi:hypothetical protein
MARSGILRRFLAIAAAGAILSGPTACSYLEWRRSRHAAPSGDGEGEPYVGEMSTPITRAPCRASRRVL